MRNLITFIVILIGLVSVMDHVHIPPNTVTATTVKGIATSQEISKKPEPKIEAATYDTPPPPKYTRLGGCEQYRKLISQYDWNVRTMMAVMEAESFNRVEKISCDSAVVGDDFPIAGVHKVSCGLFQVRTVAEWRGTCDQLKDPEFNVSIAYKIYQGQGMSAWSAYTNGSYLQYLR